MSNENQETIADIVSELRSEPFAEGGAKPWLHYLADRVEAAENHSVTSNRFGNAAKMREALESFNAVDLSGFKFPLDGDSSTIYNSNKKDITIPYWRVAELLNGVKAAQDMSKATLSAPPRNCDRFSNANEALEAFANEKGETLIEFVRWLFTEAKGETNGRK